MSMSAQHDLKVCVSGLPVDFRRMRKQNRDPFQWNGGGSLLDIVSAVVVGIVNPSQIDLLITADNRFGFIEQHSNPHCFNFRDHPDRVVIAENRVNRYLEVVAHACQAIKSNLEGAECLAAEVACYDTDVIFKTWEDLYQTLHGSRIHVRVHVGDVQYREPVKRCG